MIIEKGTINDIDELEDLYNDLNDYLESNINYPGWIKHIYPIRQTALEGIENESLFVLKTAGRIAGSIILNHKPETAYEEADWNVSADYKDVFVVHTLVVHPHFMQRGVAFKLMTFAKEYAIRLKMRSIRLDVSVNNAAAISLYEKLGYTYIATVDLQLGYEHLKWFRLYELLLESV